MSSFSDDRLACYDYAVTLICHFAECFVLPFQRAISIRYFTLGLFL